MYKKYKELTRELKLCKQIFVCRLGPVYMGVGDPR